MSDYSAAQKTEGVKASPIESKLEILIKSTLSLSDRLDVLVAKLDIVLSPSAPSEVSISKEGDSNCKMGEKLSQAIKELGKMEATVKDTIHRLQL